jgi:hypothetical protein
MDAATLQMQRFHAQTKELQESLGSGLMWVLKGVYSAFSSTAAAALELAGGVTYVIGAWEKLKGNTAQGDVILNMAKDFTGAAAETVGGFTTTGWRGNTSRNRKSAPSGMNTSFGKSRSIRLKNMRRWKMELEEVLAGAANTITRTREAYGNIDTLYNRAAIVASQKLNIALNEYQVAQVQLAFEEAKISLKMVDDDTYIKMASLAAMAGRFSRKNSDKKMLDSVEDTLIKEMAAKLVPDQQA